MHPTSSVILGEATLKWSFKIILKINYYPFYDHRNLPPDEAQEGAFSTDQIQERRTLLQVSKMLNKNTCKCIKDQLNLVLDDLNNDKRKIHDLDAEYEFAQDEIPRLQTQVKQVEGISR